MEVRFEDIRQLPLQDPVSRRLHVELRKRLDLPSSAVKLTNFPI